MREPDNPTRAQTLIIVLVWTYVAALRRGRRIRAILGTRDLLQPGNLLVGLLDPLARGRRYRHSDQSDRC